MTISLLLWPIAADISSANIWIISVQLSGGRCILGVSSVLVSMVNLLMRNVHKRGERAPPWGTPRVGVRNPLYIVQVGVTSLTLKVRSVSQAPMKRPFAGSTP